ncbi:uncharacterized protein LOC144821712 [Lissotriton helveticus]
MDSFHWKSSSFSEWCLPEAWRRGDKAAMKSWFLPVERRVTLALSDGILVPAGDERRVESPSPFRAGLYPVLYWEKQLTLTLPNRISHAVAPNQDCSAVRSWKGGPRGMTRFNSTI